MGNGDVIVMGVLSGCFMVNICSCAICFGVPPTVLSTAITTTLIGDHTQLAGPIMEGLIPVSLSMVRIAEGLYPSIGLRDMFKMEAIGILIILEVEVIQGDIGHRGARGLVVEEADPIALVEVVHLEGNKYGMARSRN